MRACLLTISLSKCICLANTGTFISEINISYERLTIQEIPSDSGLQQVSVIGLSVTNCINGLVAAESNSIFLLNDGQLHGGEHEGVNVFTL